jgi:regulator of sigma E protease
LTFLITLLAFAATLELLVVIHEGGHFLAARFCGVRVIRFSVGFGPILWKIRGKSGTEFALSLLPLGGYVKMLDSRDPTTPALTAKDKAEDFEGKKLWQRALIVFAGPFMNLLFAVLILWVLSGRMNFRAVSPLLLRGRPRPRPVSRADSM